MMKIAEIVLSLKALKLKEFAAQYQEVADKSMAENLSHVEYLKLLADVELEARHHKRIAQLLRTSRIPRRKDIKDFEVTRIPDLHVSTVKDLAKGDFIDRHENLLIFGNPGTGKTHLVIALTQEWCNMGRRVLFTTAAELMQKLLKAKEKMEWNEYVRTINKNEVLVIDDISYVPCDRKETDLLFLLLASRYEHRSTVITSNLPFSQWGTIFKDEMTTAAAVDRLVHHATVLSLNAQSYRKEKAKQNQQTTETV
jgi:DNA replication protein DnaC